MTDPVNNPPTGAPIIPPSQGPIIPCNKPAEPIKHDTAVEDAIGENAAELLKGEFGDGDK